MSVDVVAPGRKTAAAMAGGTVALGTVVAGIPGFRQTTGVEGAEGAKGAATT